MSEYPKPKSVDYRNSPYLYQQVQTASPEKLIIMLYDFGIQACHNRNRQLASRVLIELIAALNFEYKEMALMFYNLYKYSLDKVHSNAFEEPLAILRELRQAWDSAVVQKNQAKS